MVDSLEGVLEDELSVACLICSLKATFAVLLDLPNVVFQVYGACVAFVFFGFSFSLFFLFFMCYRIFFLFLALFSFSLSSLSLSLLFLSLNHI